jgi:hypothetical protein
MYTFFFFNVKITIADSPKPSESLYRTKEQESLDTQTMQMPKTAIKTPAKYLSVFALT